jgi:hypothetical protein
MSPLPDSHSNGNTARTKSGQADAHSTIRGGSLERPTRNIAELECGDGTPEIHPHTGDPDHHFIQMPSIARPRPTPAQPSRNWRAELQHPTPHRFIGDVEPAFGEQFLHVAVAQREAELEPDCMLDDLGRKTMAAIAERSHAAILTQRAGLRDPLA